MNNLIKFFVILVIILILRRIYEPLYFKSKNNLKIQNIYNYIFIYNEIFIDNDYKQLHLNKCDNEVVFDIGGNNGLFSLYVNEKYKNSEIHIFEPINILYNNILHNVENNNKINYKNNNKFIINNIGLGDKYETQLINYFPNADGLSTIKNDISLKKDKIINSKCSVYTNTFVNKICKTFYEKLLNSDNFNYIKNKITIDTLSNYIIKNNIKKIDKIKIDVEGYELEILKGIKPEHMKMIKIMFIEVENYRPEYLTQMKNILNNDFNVTILNENKSWCFVIAKNNNYSL